MYKVGRKHVLQVMIQCLGLEGRRRHELSHLKDGTSPYPQSHVYLELPYDVHQAGMPAEFLSTLRISKLNVSPCSEQQTFVEVLVASFWGKW